MIKNAIIYKSGTDEIAVVVLAGKVHMSIMYGSDYSVEGYMIGGFVLYHITVKLNGVIVGCAPVEEYVNEIWKGVPDYE
ncbi:hypothetical protein KAR91_45930 [Candidatus Pacearchaeota archaeon]|nr:hypothetical protein [Candidatus Pacearchaeota archaeon]